MSYMNPVETQAERVANLRRHIEQGTLVREAWGDGYDRACLLAALSPEASEAEYAEACPADVMPLWLASLTPHMDDRGSDAAWPAMVRRYADVAARWNILDEGAWHRCNLKARLVAAREVRSYVPARRKDVLATIDGVIDWLSRGSPPKERRHLRSAARQLLRWPGDATDRASYYAADVAALVTFGETGVGVLVDAAYAAAIAADAVCTGSPRMRAEALSTAWDHMTDGILGAIEAECDAAEAGNA